MSDHRASHQALPYTESLDHVRMTNGAPLTESDNTVEDRAVEHIRSGQKHIDQRARRMLERVKAERPSSGA